MCNSNITSLGPRDIIQRTLEAPAIAPAPAIAILLKRCHITALVASAGSRHYYWHGLADEYLIFTAVSRERMRRMNTVATPGLYHNCRAVLQRPAELVSVSASCAQCNVPIVYPSCASGHHRRALSQFPQRLHVRSGPVLQCGRTFETLVCSATATERKTLTTLSLKQFDLPYPLHFGHLRRSCICKDFPTEEF